jgi:hypothetical protein
MMGKEQKVKVADGKNTHRSKGYSWLFLKNKKERNDDDEWR